MYVKKESVSITTDASGDATGEITVPLNGRVLQVDIDTGDWASTVDVTVKVARTQQQILAASPSADANYAPRQATHTTAGAAALYASGGIAVLDYLFLADDTLEITIAQGGNTKTGTITVQVG